jgi:membrane-bound metal-dependent hydrolase YbcI (DUF457 family)
LQTYTHILIGSALGACLHPGDLTAQGACVFGALLPDVAQVPSYLVDRARGRQPLATVRPEVLRVKFAAHSILVWGTLLGAALAVGWIPFVAFCTGGLSHPLVDALTHKDARYRENDAGFLWPLSLRLARYTGLWEYRIDHGVLRPKPLEATVCVLSLAVFTRAWL